MTALVLRFIGNIRKSLKNDVITKEKYVSSEEIKKSKLLWIRANQKLVQGDNKYEQLELQLNLKKDGIGIIRTFSRMNNACLPTEAKAPIFLSKDHRLSELIVLYCHSKAYHRGVRQTLNEFRANYWITCGRFFIKKILRPCTVCRKLNARPFKYPGHSEIPAIRFDERYPFVASCVDYLGPLYCSPVRGRKEEACKAHVVLYTCFSTRAVILDVVHSADANTFVNSLRRFISRRGCPAVMVSDNGSSFKPEETQKFAASKYIE